MLKLSRLLLVLLLAGGFAALGNGRAEASTGLASWYGAGFEGSPTASGDVFDPNAFTTAHKTLPFGTRLTVSYRGRSAQVTVNDRGPYSGGRDLDLSQGAAEYLGLTRAGVDWVDYSVTGGYCTRQAAGYDPRDSAGNSRDTRGPRYASGRAETGGGSYVVRPGDTLSGISAQLGTPVRHLASANGIANPNLISVGQTIYY